MADISIAVLGLGRIGASVALAIKRYNHRQDRTHRFHVTGYGANNAQIRDAQKLGAVDTIVRDVVEAVRGKDIVIMALPYSEVQGAYQYIGQELRPGAVVMDFSTLKQPSLNWAKKFVHEGAHLIGVTPILNPKYVFDALDEPARAAADLFDDGALILVPSVTCIPEAIELGRDFAEVIGAASQFSDPVENDSLIAATEALPSFLGLAYYMMLYNSQGWDDVQKFTNPAFGQLTHHLFDTHPDDLRDLWMNNRDNLMRYTDELMATLRSLRRVLADNDEAAVEAAVGGASAEYEKWYNRRLTMDWDREGIPTETGGPDIMSSLFGGYLANRLRGKRDGDENNA
jgi:prephenate dehydrogenase